MHSVALCNCDKDDGVWREDGGLMTDKTKLSVKRNSSVLGMLLALKDAAIHGTALTYFSLNRQYKECFTK